MVWEEERKKKTPRFLPSYLPELMRKKNVFCDKKWPLQHEKGLKNFEFWGRTFLVKGKQNTHPVAFKNQWEVGNPGIHFLTLSRASMEKSTVYGRWGLRHLNFVFICRMEQDCAWIFALSCSLQWSSRFGCSCSSSCRNFCWNVSCFPLSATCHGSHRDAEAALE